MEGVLARIVDRIRTEQGALNASFSRESFPLAARSAPREFGLSPSRAFHIIAEIKRGSPSRGSILADDADVAGIARTYRDGGAGGISVVTESNFFLGRPEDLASVRRMVPLPVLRKDFIIHPRQVCESYNLGADMVLLIAACLPPAEMESLHGLTLSLGMMPLVEVHSQEELARVLPLQPRLLGINSRNLCDLSVDWTRALRLREKVPAGVPVIAESGIHSPAQVEILKQNGFSGALIGEYLLTHSNPRGALQELCRV